MQEDRDWAEIRPQNASAISEAGQGMLRITLLFGSFAIAIALFLTPILDRSNGSTLSARLRTSGLRLTMSDKSASTMPAGPYGSELVASLTMTSTSLDPITSALAFLYIFFKALGILL